MITCLIPKIFYANMADGLDLFVDCLGFQVLHHENELAVVERDGAKAYLVEDAEYAAKDRPEITLETDNIEALYDEIRSRKPDMLHPNGDAIMAKPWGSREFAVLDKTSVCIVFREW